MTLRNPPTVESLESRRLLTAAAVTPGFSVSLVSNVGSAATAMDIASDGRIFVAQQGGQVRVIDHGKLQAKPFVSLNVDSRNERGVIGIVLDPNFSKNHYVYVYYTAKTPYAHNRVSRFTASGDVAVPHSEKVLLDLDRLSSATNHNGGAMHFGKDGKLYIAVGENANPANSQTLTNLLGKVLRINSDGSIPTDNPFYKKAVGKNRAIWALGLRNPFTFAVQPGTGRIFINDVGKATWEEIDQGKAGANYGWNATEGPFDQKKFPKFTEPFYSYNHGKNDVNGSAITGGTFYSPAKGQFPAKYRNDYFYSDLGGGYVKVLNLANKSVTTLATGFKDPVDLDVGPDGALYVLQHDGGAGGAGAIYKISF